MKKNLFIRLSLLWVIISFSQLLFSQNITETLNLADNCYKNQNFDDALYYYQRVLYFGNKKYKEKSYMKIAKCYYEQNHNSKAYEYYGFAYSSCEDDSLKKEILFKKVMTLLHEGSYKFALVELYDLQVSNESFYFSKKKELYFTVTFFMLEDFVQSQIHAYNYFNFNDLTKFSEIKRLYKLNDLAGKKSKKRVSVMSTVIPGLGQLYTGDYRNSVNSFLLTSTLLGLGVYVGYNYGILNSVVSVFPWFYRYYAGGKKKAKIVAKNKIDEKRQKILESILNLMNNI